MPVAAIPGALEFDRPELHLAGGLADLEVILRALFYETAAFLFCD